MFAPLVRIIVKCRLTELALDDEEPMAESLTLLLQRPQRPLRSADRCDRGVYPAVVAGAQSGSRGKRILPSVAMPPKRTLDRATCYSRWCHGCAVPAHQQP